MLLEKTSVLNVWYKHAVEHFVARRCLVRSYILLLLSPCIGIGIKSDRIYVMIQV